MNRLFAVLPLCLAMLIASAQQTPMQAEEADTGTFNQEEILERANAYFGEASEGLAKIIAKVFEDQGKPNGIILGEEIAGAVAVGLRYGKGEFITRSGGTQKVYWQGPSVGLDFGGNASKVFVLVYNIRHANELYKRFPGVDGSFYVIAGFGVNYQRVDDVVLAPIRTGIGVRAGANFGYAHYTREPSWNPF